MERSRSLTYIALPSLSLVSTSGPGYEAHDFANGDEEAARFETPNPFTKYAVLVDKANVITPTKPSESIVGFEFALYSNSVRSLFSLS